MDFKIEIYKDGSLCTNGIYSRGEIKYSINVDAKDLKEICEAIAIGICFAHGDTSFYSWTLSRLYPPCEMCGEEEKPTAICPQCNYAIYICDDCREFHVEKYHAECQSCGKAYGHETTCGCCGNDICEDCIRIEDHCESVVGVCCQSDY